MNWMEEVYKNMTLLLIGVLLLLIAVIIMKPPMPSNAQIDYTDYSQYISQAKPGLSCHLQTLPSTYFCQANANGVENYLTVECFLSNSTIFCGDGKSYEKVFNFNSTGSFSI